MSMAGLERHMELAKMAVEETGRGIYEDKITKNMFATEYIYHSIKYGKTVGVISENDEEGYVEIAEPIGIIAGVTPVTNPTSTTMFKSIIAAKTRNVIIFGFHPSAQKCSVEAAKTVRDAAIKAGAFDFLTKPLDLDHLNHTVKNALKGRQQEQHAHEDPVSQLLQMAGEAHAAVIFDGGGFTLFHPRRRPPQTSCSRLSSPSSRQPALPLPPPCRP